MYFLVDVKLNYKLKQANFALGDLLTKVGVKASVITRGGRTFNRVSHLRKIKLDNALADATVKTASTGKIPSRREILGIAGVGTKDFLANPIGFIKAAPEAELAAFKIIEKITGLPLPGKAQMIMNGGVKIKNYVQANPNVAINLTVNTGGAIASGIAAPVGLPVKIAADLGGALATRKAINDVILTRQVVKDLGQDAAFKSANIFRKIKKVNSESIARIETRTARELAAKNLTEDTTGWAIGNTVAEVTGALSPIAAKIPLRGGAVAMAINDEVAEAVTRIRKGANIKTVIPETTKTLINKFPNAVRKGNRREQAFRLKLERRLARMRKELEKKLTVGDVS